MEDGDLTREPQGLDRVRALRDRLRVQATLARLEAREELREDLQALEFRYEDLQSRLDAAGDAAATTRDGVEAATRLLIEELERGYARIADALES